MIEREEEIASTIPADLGALPRLRRFRLRGMALRVIYYRPQRPCALSVIIIRTL